jgi:enoyl-CoA hydratase
MIPTNHQLISVKSQDGVGSIVLDRPALANAIDLQMLKEIETAIDALEAEQEVRCALVTGAGRVFSAGGDVDQMRSLSLAEGEQFVLRGQAVLERLASSPLVFIAALNGPTLGGGLELALACDIRIADPSATLGFPEVGLGLIPGWGGTQRAARLLGHSRASLLVLTGERLAASRAAELGLVDEVVEAGSVVGSAEVLARRIGRNSPSAIAASKRALLAAARQTFDDGLTTEREAWLTAFSTQDRIEGLSAFLQKRPPRWTNS